MKIKHLTILFLALIAPWMANADPVDQETAREVALKYVNAKAQTPLRGANDLQLVTTYHINRGDDAFHIFNTPTGFVIVSADDCATPILGYSDEGQFDMDNIPIQLQDYLQGFVKQIEYGIENHLVADETTAKQWKLIKATGRLNEDPKLAVVGPLLTTTWSQECYYNALCPEDPLGSCGHVSTGCVATAMAQIMRYWNYPKCGVGTFRYTPNGYPEQNVDFGATFYDWDHMPNNLTSSSSPEQVHAVATLMWHCGVSVEMGYAASESSAMSEDVISALLIYFNYANDLREEYREGNSNFLQKVKNCLDQSRPLYYSARNAQTGHAFVCDGYDSDDMLHFNWGWGSSGDGFFAIDALVNGYDMDHFAIFNIHPRGEQGASYQVNVSASSSSSGMVSGTGQYNWGDVCTVTATPGQGNYFLNWMEDGQIVSTQPNYSFMVVSDRNLVANFSTIDPFSDYIQFADSQVKALCVANWDTNGDGELSKGEAAEVASLGSVFSGNTQITSFDELRYFIGLKGLSIGTFVSCSNLNSVTIPQSIAYFACDVWFNCTSLTNVKYMNDLEHWFGIRYSTLFSNPLYWASNFYINDELVTDLVIPETVTEIRSNEFFNVTCLTSVTIPNSITRIGDDGFYGCTGLTSVYYTGDMAQWCGIVFEDKDSNPLFYAHNLYFGNQLMTDLVIPNSVTSIGNHAFISCSSITSITIPNSVTSIGDNAFYDCSSLTSVTIPNSVTSVGRSAFAWCAGLVSVTLSNSLDSIKEQTFSDCSNLASIEIPNSVNSIGEAAFSYSGLAGTLVIPNSVTSIGQYAFCDCLSLTSVALSNAMTIIDEGLFSECRNLASAIIPASVTYIGNKAFRLCTGLTSLFVEAETPPALGSFVFEAVPTSVSVYVPCGLVETYRADDNWNGFSRIYDMCSPMTITASVISEEGGTVTGVGTYNLGSVCTLTATSNDGYVFLYWSENGEVVSYDASYSFIVSSNRNLVANFEGLKMISAIANPSEGGVVTGMGEYFFGDTCTLLATANTDYSFLYWSENGEQVSSDAEYSFVVTEDRNLEAIFYLEGSTCSIVFNLYDSWGDGWSGNYLVINYEDGNSEQLTLESGSSASFSRFVETGTHISLTWIKGSFSQECSFNITYLNEVSIYQGSNLNSDFQYVFAVNCSLSNAPHFINAVAYPAEGGVVTGMGEYIYGDTCTLLATANNDYSFLYWTENGEQVSSDAEYSFVVTEDRNIEAVFALIGDISFADANVKTLCVANWDTNGDGELSYTEAAMVTSLGDVFAENEQITSFDELQYFNGLRSIGYKAFYHCYYLESIIIPSSVISIGDEAFYYCSSLTSIAFPASMYSIGHEAFTACYALTTIEIPKSVSFIGDYTFNYCIGLQQIVVDAENTVYDSRDNCNAIIETSTNTLITGCMNTIIPNSVISIGEDAFESCEGLTTIVIPASVTSIGMYAFAWSGLTSMTVLAETPPTLAEYVFQEVPTNIPVYVPCDFVSLYQAADGWNSFTNYYGIDCHYPPCRIPSGLCVNNTTAHSAELSWTALSGESEWTIYYKKSTDATYTQVTGVTENPYTLTGLEPASDYTYYLVANCTVDDASEPSAEFSFNTECEPFTITSATPYTQDFETPIVTSIYNSTGGQVPNCWDNPFTTGTDAAGEPHLIKAGASYNYATSGQVLFFYGLGNNYVTLPEFTNDLNRLQIGFKWATESRSSGTLTLGYITEQDMDYNTFTPIQSYAASEGESYRALKEETVELSSLPADASRLVFRWYVNSQWGCNIDDVVVSLIPNTFVTQTINLLEGWNWISTYIESDPINMLEELESALGEHGIQIKSKDKVSAWDEEEEEWDGSLQNLGLTNGNTYMVQTNSNCTVFLEGPASIPADHEITLFPNTWTWIGFPCAMEVDIEDAFANFIPMAGDQIKSKDTVAAWDEEEEEWSGSMSKLIPGTGYMFFSNSAYPRTLIFQTGTKSK